MKTRLCQETYICYAAKLLFAPIDASFSDDAPLLPSGFRMIPTDSSKDVSSPKCILGLTSALEVGAAGNKSLAYNSRFYLGVELLKPGKREGNPFSNLFGAILIPFCPTL